MAHYNFVKHSETGRVYGDESARSAFRWQSRLGECNVGTDDNWHPYLRRTGQVETAAGTFAVDPNAQGRFKYGKAVGFDRVVLHLYELGLELKEKALTPYNVQWADTAAEAIIAETLRDARANEVQNLWTLGAARSVKQVVRLKAAESGRFIVGIQIFGMAAASLRYDAPAEGALPTAAAALLADAKLRVRLLPRERKMLWAFRPIRFPDAGGVDNCELLFGPFDLTAGGRVEIDPTYSGTVGANLNDAYWVSNLGTWVNNAAFLASGRAGGGNYLTSFMRWDACTAAGTIGTSTVTFTAQATNAQIPALPFLWYALKADNVGDYSSDRSATAVTDASVPHTPVAWTAESTYVSPNLAAPIQEVVTLRYAGADPTTGVNKSLCLRWGLGAGLNLSDVRYPYSYDGSVAKAPAISIDYTLPTGTVGPYVGPRRVIL